MRSGNARQLELRLRDRDGIFGVAQIGTDLRVLAAPAIDEAALRGLANEPGVEIETVAPNLEDVFVAATRHARSAEAA